MTTSGITPKQVKEKMKKEIDQEEYLQLVGLKTLADDHQQHINDIATSMAKIIGEQESEYGSHDWTDDLLWGGWSDVKGWLNRINIKVKEEDAN